MTFFNEQVAIEFLLEDHELLMRVESSAGSVIIPTEGRIIQLNAHVHYKEFMVERITHSYNKNAPFQQVIQIYVKEL